MVSFDVADIALVLHIVQHLSLIVSQLSESVDDNTEDDIQQDNNDDQEEGQGEHYSQVVFCLCRVRLRGQYISYPASHSQAVVHC